MLGEGGGGGPSSFLSACARRESAWCPVKRESYGQSHCEPTLGAAILFGIYVSPVQAYAKLSTLAGFSLSGSASRVSGGVVDGVTVHSAGVSDLLQSSDVAAAFGRIAAGKNGLWSANTGTGPTKRSSWTLCVVFVWLVYLLHLMCLWRLLCLFVGCFRDAITDRLCPTCFGVPCRSGPSGCCAQCGRPVPWRVLVGGEAGASGSGSLGPQQWHGGRPPRGPPQPPPRPHQGPQGLCGGGPPRLPHRRGGASQYQRMSLAFLCPHPHTNTHINRIPRSLPHGPMSPCMV